MSFEPIVAWITQNPQWSFAIIFSIAFLESLALIGLLVPGWILLVGVGVLIGTGTIDYFSSVLFCFIGAVIGEYISFAVGRHYQDKVRHWQIFLKHPDWLTTTDHFFERFGVASIALGRFVGPVRAFVPLIAGMSSMPMGRFQLINFLSASVWAPLYLIPGMIVGASTQIDTQNSWQLIVVLAIASVSIWFSTAYVRNLWRIRHPEVKAEYDHHHVIIKLILALTVFSFSIWYLMFGPLHELFYQLLDLLMQIIFSG